jgi:hypothetical protein
MVIQFETLLRRFVASKGIAAATIYKVDIFPPSLVLYYCENFSHPAAVRSYDQQLLTFCEVDEFAG